MHCTRLMLLLCLFMYANTQYVDIAFINNNIERLTLRSNIRGTIYKLINNGDMNVLKHYLNALRERKVNYNNELDDAVNTKLNMIHGVYNKLKYKDEYGIQKLSPAFMWYEDLYTVKLTIQHSSSFGMTQCNEVDGEEFIIRKDKQNIIYRAKCVVSGYQIKYELKLKLYKKVKLIRNEIKERGQTIYYIEKDITNEMWDRLQPAGERLPENSRYES